MKPEIEQAIEAIRKKFSVCEILIKEDGSSGAYVIVDSVDLGSVYSEETRNSWIGFHISFQYPFADIYPHHVRNDLTRGDNKPLGEGMQVTRYEGFDRQSVQISRRSKNRDPMLETALHKLLKVIEWVKTHP